MPKLLLEYKGIPGIIEHSFEKVDIITYIVVFKNQKSDLVRKDFDSVTKALEFSEDLESKLVFVYLQTKKEDGFNYAIYNYLDFINNKFIISKNIEKIHKGFKIIIDPNFDSFSIDKRKSTNVTQFSLYYSRRRTIKKDGSKEYEYLESFYELVPKYEDIFLESLFFLEILKNNILVSEKNEIEAYLLQAKLQFDKKNIPSKPILNDDDKTDTEAVTINKKDKIDDLIGLEKIKLEIMELKALASFRQKRIELGLPATPSTLHMVFSGNPGTGKTSVARLLGQIYYDMGILAENKVTEVSRQDLVGEFIGHTAPKTQKVFEKALGGILFIDEAYSLIKSGNDFGKEAIETLLKLMEDNREKIVVIIAGYPNEMEELLSSNPGLKSRFSKFLNFDDYTKEELLLIFLKMVLDYGNTLTNGATFKIEHLIDTYYESGKFSANARSIRNIFEEITKKQSLRLSKLENPSQEEMTSFIDKDLPNTLD